MKIIESAPLFFFDTLTEYDFTSHAGNVVHILCIDGNISFTIHRTHYNISSGDYVILTNGVSISSVSQSEECQVIVMSIAESFISTNIIRSNYGIIGHLSLLQNPVMKLTAEDFDKCKKDMVRLRERLSDLKHLFREEMIGALLKAQWRVSSRPAALMRDFIGLLLDGDYASNRNLEYYASRLCITPHYLSEISKSISGQPATYWIDHFLVKDIMQLLIQKDLSLNEIAYRLNFSSVSYLSRYISKHLCMTPSDFRKSISQ